VRYQTQEYLILPDGSLRPLAAPSEMNAVIGWSLGLISMVFMAELVKSLAADWLEPEKQTPRLLLQTASRKPRGELEELVIALRDAPNVEEQTFIKLTAPRRAIEQYRKLSYQQIREIEQRYPRSERSAPYQAETLSDPPYPIPPDLAWLLAANRPILDLLPTTEATESKVEGILKQLKAGVESIQQSDQFRLFLSTMGKFHDYSIGNLILIMLQKPQATHVAGFNTWKDLGRWVKSGEKGIAILAPVFPPAASCEKCGAKLPRSAKFCPKCGAEAESGEEAAANPRYFRVVYVFERSSLA
jgi:hypothetical protein